MQKGYGIHIGHDPTWLIACLLGNHVVWTLFLNVPHTTPTYILRVGHGLPMQGARPVMLKTGAASLRPISVLMLQIAPD